MLTQIPASEASIESPWCQLSNQSNIYKIHLREKISWASAYFRCKREGSQLFWFESEKEAVAMISAMEESYKSIKNIHPHSGENGWLINAHRYMYNASHSSWPDGKPLDEFSSEILKMETKEEIYMRQVLGSELYISFMEENRSDCFVLKKDGKITVKTINCLENFEEIGFICKGNHPLKKFAILKTENSCLPKCNDGWFHYQNACYFFDMEADNISWAEALHDCRKIGGEMISFENREEVVHIIKEANESFHHFKESPLEFFFLNIHRYFYNYEQNEKKPVFFWNDGTLAPYRINVSYFGEEVNPRYHCGVISNDLKIASISCLFKFSRSLGLICSKVEENISNKNELTKLTPKSNSESSLYADDNLSLIYPSCEESFKRSFDQAIAEKFLENLRGKYEIKRKFSSKKNHDQDLFPNEEQEETNVLEEIPKVQFAWLMMALWISAMTLCINQVRNSLVQSAT